jgi:predicted naringenin-chalcone synthase
MRLGGIGLAVPGFRASQVTSLRFLARVLAASAPSGQRDRTLELVERLAGTSGIDFRHSVVPDYARTDPAEFVFFPKSWDLEPFPSTARRMHAYEAASVPLAAEAAGRALAAAGTAAAEVDHIILCTCTGFFAPGPDIHLMHRLGLRRNVERTVIGFMGCHAGFNGLRVADHIVRARPEAVVLLVCVELCSLHYQKRPVPELVVANTLFADGSAAVVCGSSNRFPHAGAGVQALASAVHPGSSEQMAWRIGDTGFEMRLAPTVPSTLQREAPAFVDALLDRARLRRTDVAAWALHPGGQRILEAVAAALELGDAAVEPSFSVLRRFGNMSSGTILFVIAEHLRDGALPGPLVVLGFGPGLTIEGAVLEP